MQAEGCTTRGSAADVPEVMQRCRAKRSGTDKEELQETTRKRSDGRTVHAAEDPKATRRGRASRSDPEEATADGVPGPENVGKMSAKCRRKSFPMCHDKPTGRTDGRTMWTVWTKKKRDRQKPFILLAFTAKND